MQHIGLPSASYAHRKLISYQDLVCVTQSNPNPLASSTCPLHNKVTELNNRYKGDEVRAK